MAAWVKCATAAGDRYVNFDLVVLVSRNDPENTSNLLLSTGTTLSVSQSPEKLMESAALARGKT